MAERKIAIVTGSTRGIGRETAKELAEKGYHVVITGRDKAKGKAFAEELTKRDLRADYFPLDVSNTQNIEAFSDEVLGKFGRVDVLVNNAGIFEDQKQTGHALADYADTVTRTFETNTLGPLLLGLAFLPQMKKQGYGRIVNLSSGMGQLSEMGGGYPAYRISKTALNAVTKILANEAVGSNILVNSMCPGWVKTDMGGAGAERTVEQGADTAVWLATLPDSGPTGGFFRDRKPIAW